MVFLEPEWPYLPPYDEDLGGGDGTGTLGVDRCDTWFNPGGSAIKSYNEKRHTNIKIFC